MVSVCRSVCRLLHSMWKLGPDSIVISLSFRLENGLRFLLDSVTCEIKLLVFLNFLSVGNLKPNLKPFFKLKLKQFESGLCFLTLHIECWHKKEMEQ